MFCCIITNGSASLYCLFLSSDGRSNLVSIILAKFSRAIRARYKLTTLIRAQIWRFLHGSVVSAIYHVCNGVEGSISHLAKLLPRVINYLNNYGKRSDSSSCTPLLILSVIDGLRGTPEYHYHQILNLSPTMNLELLQDASRACSIPYYFVSQQAHEDTADDGSNIKTKGHREAYRCGHQWAQCLLYSHEYALCHASSTS